MRVRRIAVLIDGGFFIKRLKKLVPPKYCTDAAAIANSARILCRRHVVRLTGIRDYWLDHVYRLFYYDAKPFQEIAHHPILNHQIHFDKTPEAKFREQLFNEIRKARKFALRLGHVTNADGWRIKDGALTKKLLRTKDWIHVMEAAITASQSGVSAPVLTGDQINSLAKVVEAWRSLSADDVVLGLRQKGVDMRMGLDISTLTLKKQVDTIILVTGDSDFVPAAKMARREGIEFLLDPMWQSVADELHEHVDGIVSVFKPLKEPSSVGELAEISDADPGESGEGEQTR